MSNGLLKECQRCTKQFTEACTPEVSWLKRLKFRHLYAAPGNAGAKIAYKARYDNFIGGKWVAPVKGQYFDVITPINGKTCTQVARSGAEDIELALDAAHAAADKWGKTAPPSAPTCC
jgi:hypothetical protein